MTSDNKLIMYQQYIDIHHSSSLLRLFKFTKRISAWLGSRIRCMEYTASTTWVVGPHVQMYRWTGPDGHVDVHTDQCWAINTKWTLPPPPTVTETLKWFAYLQSRHRGGLFVETFSLLWIRMVPTERKTRRHVEHVSFQVAGGHSWIQSSHVYCSLYPSWLFSPTFSTWTSVSKQVCWWMIGVGGGGKIDCWVIKNMLDCQIKGSKQLNGLGSPKQDDWGFCWNVSLHHKAQPPVANAWMLKVLLMSEHHCHAKLWADFASIIIQPTPKKVLWHLHPCVPFMFQNLRGIESLFSEVRPIGAFPIIKAKVGPLKRSKATS